VTLVNSYVLVPGQSARINFRDYQKSGDNLGVTIVTDEVRDASRAPRLTRRRRARTGSPNSPARRRTVKSYLTEGERLRLLCIGGECNLFTVRAIQSMENAMTNETLTVRVAQAMLAVTFTAASVIALQFAMLAG